MTNVRRCPTRLFYKSQSYFSALPFPLPFVWICTINKCSPHWILWRDLVLSCDGHSEWAWWGQTGKLLGADGVCGTLGCPGLGWESWGSQGGRRDGTAAAPVQSGWWRSPLETGWGAADRLVPYWCPSRQTGGCWSWPWSCTAAVLRETETVEFTE